LLARTNKGNHTFQWGTYDRAPLKTWSTERMTLLGDAAHAVTPHLGQGANQAVEDAITLAVLLQDAQVADVPLRLRRYEDLRIERTRQVHDGSGEAGALYRSTELWPAQQAERIVAINDRLQLDTHDAERNAPTPSQRSDNDVRRSRLSRSSRANEAPYPFRP
jgi:salicylate hydroxylase